MLNMGIYTSLRRRGKAKGHPLVLIRTIIFDDWFVRNTGCPELARKELQCLFGVNSENNCVGACWKIAGTGFTSGMYNLCG